MINWIRKKHKIIRVLSGFLCLIVVFFLVTTTYYINEVRIARRDTQALFASAVERYGTELKLSDLSPGRKTMLIHVVDPRFYQHHGVDLEEPGARMTTLTQGLVKLLYYPNGFKQGIAKLRQSFIAKYALNSIISKDDQILLFMNICSLGHEKGKAIHGFANGCRVYLGKEYYAISDDEFLTLLVMLDRPNALKPGTPGNREKIKRIKASLANSHRTAGQDNSKYIFQQNRPFSHKVCMTIIKLITDAIPD